MTREPGAELDAIICEALGIEPLQHAFEVDPSDGSVKNLWYPRVSTNLAHVGMVVEALGKRGVLVSIWQGTFSQQWHARAETLNPEGMFKGSASAIPHALCLAVLAAREAGSCGAIWPCWARGYAGRSTPCGCAPW